MDEVRLSNEQKIKALHVSLDQITEKIDKTVERLVTIDSFVDTNDQQIREKLGELQLTCEKFKTLLYGSESLRLTGQVDRIDILEKKIIELEDQKRAMVNQLKGVRLALIAFGIGSTSALGTALSLILK